MLKILGSKKVMPVPVRKLDKLNSERPHFMVVLVVVLAFLALLHGGINYESNSLVRGAGIGVFCAIYFILLANKGLIIVREIVVISVFLIFVMLGPALLGLLRFDEFSGFAYIATNLFMFLFFSQMILVCGCYSLKSVAYFFFAFAMLASIIAFFIMYKPLNFLDVEYGKSGYFRLIGTFSTPNRYGEVPAVGFLAAMFILKYVRSNKFLVGLGSLFLLVSVLLSGSKGVMLGLMAATFYLFFAFGLSIRNVITFIIFVCVVVATSYFFQDELVAATKLDKILEGKAQLGSGREDIWASAFELIVNASAMDLLVGKGVGASNFLIGRNSHSTYFDLFIEYGINPVVFIIFLSIYILLSVFKRNSKEPLFLFGSCLIVFCLARGIAMPTILNGANMAMIAFWAGVAFLFVGRRYRWQSTVGLK